MADSDSNLETQTKLTQARVDELLRSTSSDSPGGNKRRRQKSSPDVSRPPPLLNPVLHPPTLQYPPKTTPEMPDLLEYIDSVVETKVNKAVLEYVQIIREQQDLITSQQDKIRELETRLAASRATPSNPPGQSPEIRQRLDNLEQYSRRNTLRLTGVTATVRDGETTDDLVIDIAKTMGVTITHADIDRSHFNSRPDAEKGRELLVKFIRHNDKVRFISKRRKLREAGSQKHSSVFVNEDLTRDRYVLLRKLIKMKKDSLINSAWSHDGNIFYKKAESDTPVKVKDTLIFEL